MRESGGLRDVSGTVGDIGGFSECVSGSVVGIGVFSASQGEMAESVGGKGVEFHDQHVGKVWRSEEEGGRKGD